MLHAHIRCIYIPFAHIDINKPPAIYMRSIKQHNVRCSVLERVKQMNARRIYAKIELIELCAFVCCNKARVKQS